MLVLLMLLDEREVDVDCCECADSFLFVGCSLCGLIGCLLLILGGMQDVRMGLKPIKTEMVGKWLSDSIRQATKLCTVGRFCL